MATTTGDAASPQLSARFRSWLLEGLSTQSDRPPGPHTRPTERHQHPWWKVMCLTGVDYFSTLGYQPGIAALAAGVLSPIATILLVLLTLFGALPIYRRVAAESPHGEGSIAMLERLLSWWQGKLFVLVLLGFVATDFIITITLSAADATAHVLENPLVPGVLDGHEVGVTLVLVALLGGVFLKGFTEAIGIAVGLVATYLALNLVVVTVALGHLVANPQLVVDWRQLLTTSYGSPLAMVAVALLVFPKLALGLSGFETGVAVMPLVRGNPHDPPERPVGRIRNTRKLLTTAALIMSGFLITSSFATTVLIPHQEFEEGGQASGRALAYLAHGYLGSGFGTAYDLSTIGILWFAGASAMAGLLNIVPRYLPRYGMAPEWTRAVRPLALAFTAIAVGITVIFRADVEAQAGAYATGVLVLMLSAAVAVTLSVRHGGRRPALLAFGLIALVFAYTTIANIIERPDGVKIAAFFIAAILVTSLISRVTRATELRVTRVELDDTARRFVEDAAANGEVRIIANEPHARDLLEYIEKAYEERQRNQIPPDDPVLFLEVTVADPSEFEVRLQVTGEERHGYRILRMESSAAPNAIAAVLLHLRDVTGKRPHVYFDWTEGSPIAHLLRFLFFGSREVAPVTREVLRAAEPDLQQRPFVHVV
ncbi:MAG TPA: amino acid transporter [Actinomycetota bacterium]|nr:amino acid transporter [Actinomycetota bacterium]